MAFGLQYLTRCEQSMQPDATFNTVDAAITGQSIRMWSYNAKATGANDTTAATQAANYFLPVYAYLNVGDLIWVCTNDPGFHLIYIATSAAGGVTTVQLV